MHIKFAIEIFARIAAFAKIIGREHFAIYGICAHCSAWMDLLEQSLTK